MNNCGSICKVKCVKQTFIYLIIVAKNYKFMTLINLAKEIFNVMQN